MDPATIIAMTIEAGEPLSEAAALYRLMAWLSPSYPIGAYSYSHGLEYAVEAGRLKNAQTTLAWLTDLIEQGSGFADAVLLAAAFDATAARDAAALFDIAELALALSATAELALETTAQGDAFMKITRAAWGCAAIDWAATVGPGPYALPVAVAIAGTGHGLDKASVVSAYLQSFAANLVSAAVRLIPLGQTDGQRLTMMLEPVVLATAKRALVTPLCDLGTASMMSDIASMKHETQYTRLFRS